MLSYSGADQLALQTKSAEIPARIGGHQVGTPPRANTPPQTKARQAASCVMKNGLCGHEIACRQPGGGTLPALSFTIS